MGSLRGCRWHCENGFGSLGLASAGRPAVDRLRVRLCVGGPDCGLLDLVVLQAGDRGLGVGVIHRSWGFSNGRPASLPRKKAKDA